MAITTHQCTPRHLKEVAKTTSNKAAHIVAHISLSSLAELKIHDVLRR